MAFLCGVASTAAPQSTRTGSTPGTQVEGYSRCVGASSSTAPAQMYAVQTDIDARDTSVLRGTIIYESSLASTLFNIGASCSFISYVFMRALDLKPLSILSTTVVSTPLGGISELHSVCREGSVVIEDRLLPCELVVLNMSMLDIILGMDWLPVYSAVINCYRHRITLSPEPGVTVRFIADKELPVTTCVPNNNTLSCLLASVSISDEEKTISALPSVVEDFSNVFPDDLSGLPPHREVDFGVDLAPGTNPISIAPYRFAPNELDEMRTQLNDLLRKCFIRESQSPW